MLARSHLDSPFAGTDADLRIYLFSLLAYFSNSSISNIRQVEVRPPGACVRILVYLCHVGSIFGLASFWVWQGHRVYSDVGEVKPLVVRLIEPAPLRAILFRFDLSFRSVIAFGFQAISIRSHLPLKHRHQ